MMQPHEIADLRRRLALTQHELARLLGMKHRSLVSRLEDGKRKPSPAVLQLLRLLQSNPDRFRKNLEKLAGSC